MIILELTVKQQALYYSTSLCRNKAKHKASHLLTLSLVSVFMCVCVWLCTSMHLNVYTCVCVCVWICECAPSMYRCMWGESACRGVSGGLRYSACCQHRHISPSAPLHRYANPASSECRAPDQLQFIPFCSPPLSVLNPPLSLFSLLSLSLSFNLRCLHSVFGFLFGLSCSVHGICPQWGIVGRWEDFYWAASSLGLVQRSTSFFKSSTRYKRCKIA